MFPKGLTRFLNLLLAVFMFCSVLPVTALGAQDGYVIPVNRVYGEGSLASITITGAKVLSHTASGNIYTVLLDAGTQFGAEVTAKYNFTRPAGQDWPDASKTLPGGAPYIQLKANKTDVFPVKITSLTESTSLAGGVYATKKDAAYKTGDLYEIRYRVAPPTEASNAGNIESIAITVPPAKTEYYSGQYFDPTGMAVTATYNDGSTARISEYTWSPGTVLTTSDSRVVISCAGKTAAQTVKVLPTPYIADAEALTGQFIFKPYLLGEDVYELPTWDGSSEKYKGRVIVPYGEKSGKVEIVLSGDFEVYTGEQRQTVRDKKCVLTLNTGVGGVETVVTLKSGTHTKEYTFVCYSQEFADLPDKVTEYLSVASQYTNCGNGYNPYVGINAVATLRGASGTATTTLYSPPFSLGNFGGYITYYYEKAIVDDPRNPYGIDFIAHGNSVDGSSAFAEPGNVYVSEDGKNWYILAGSLHYGSDTIWDYSRTYVKNSAGDCDWTDSLGDGGTIGYDYPLEKMYPLFPWTKELQSKVTLTGTVVKKSGQLGEFGNTEPVYPDFGYVDTAYFSDSNQARNPYAGTRNNDSGRIFPVNGRTDGLDLAWAVDQKGYPVSFPQGIHYIKVQTASGVLSGAFGEKSTEINMVRVAAPAETDVGVSSAPASITVDGSPVKLVNGVYKYDAAVGGAFKVAVTAGADANVYINGERATSTYFGEIPAHGIVRVIVQDGEKAPRIYYLTLRDDGRRDDTKYTAVTFDVGNRPFGSVENKRTITRFYDAGTKDTAFPIPVREGYTFLGWSAENGVKYSAYTPDMPAKLKLTAAWKYNKAGEINVTFRLIGATRSSRDIDFSREPGDSEYITWMATKGYALSEGNTVYDLFVKALGDAGLSSEGQDKNYVKTITAPKSLGGYDLSEFTNGVYSGWMYTIDGKHPGQGVRQQALENGDNVIVHYVNDYRYEVEDWFDDPLYPALGDGSHWNKWLLAEDKNPVGTE
jgi:uncharacterized repeat protein (TIGR02543 family)